MCGFLELADLAGRAVCGQNNKSGNYDLIMIMTVLIMFVLLA